MKKKFLFGLAGLAVMAAAVTVTVSSVNANTLESNLLTKNLEALSRGETTYEVCGSAWGDCIDGMKGPYVKITSVD